MTALAGASAATPSALLLSFSSWGRGAFWWPPQQASQRQLLPHACAHKCTAFGGPRRSHGVLQPAHVRRLRYHRPGVFRQAGARARPSGKGHTLLRGVQWYRATARLLSAGARRRSLCVQTPLLTPHGPRTSTIAPMPCAGCTKRSVHERLSTRKQTECTHNTPSRRHTPACLTSGLASCHPPR